jgi:hypothetical protein
MESCGRELAHTFFIIGIFILGFNFVFSIYRYSNIWFMNIEFVCNTIYGGLIND